MAKKEKKITLEQQIKQLSKELLKNLNIGNICGSMAVKTHFGLMV